MADDYKKTEEQFDPYNFSEIKKIQMEIERDLNKLHGFSKPDFEEVIDPNHEVQLDSELSDDISPATTYTLIPSTPSAIEPSEKFYTEVIKQETASNRTFLSKRLIVSLLIICTLGTGTLGLGIGFGLSTLQNTASIPVEVEGNNFNEAAVTAPTSGVSRQIFSTEVTTQEGSLADIVKLVDPAVVRIITNRPQYTTNPFFGNQTRTNDGSGIIFATDDERAFIVTSHHVTRGAEAVNVSVMEHEAVPARPVGNHPATDLAVISISLADLQRVGISDVAIASFGDSNNIRVGDIVLAIGNAMGEGNATTSGIISAREKEIIAMGRSFRVIQTDAAINPGSSGGPLVNKQGQIIGINSALITSEHYAIEGMGFSVPSNVAMPVIEEIMNATPRPFLGIHGLNISEEIAEHLDIPPIGVYIERVITGSSAYHAGLIRTDIITSFNGRAVFDMDQLVEEISRRNIGDTVELTILRDGREQITLQATLGANNNDNF